jgi:hypothetical protein
MIYLIITASICDKYYYLEGIESRKRTYVECISRAISLLPDGVKAIVVENNGLRETCLDDLGCDVLYTDGNFNTYIHKGVNEMNDIHSVIKHYGIEDEDMIIKLTGRYFLMDSSFISTVAGNLDKDAFMKFFNVSINEYVYDDCVLGLFAIKCKYIRNFHYIYPDLSPEIEFARFIRETISDDKLCSCIGLGLRCFFAGDLRILYV